MVLLSVVVAGLSAGLGHVGAITVPGWFGFLDPSTGGSLSTNTAGMMATTAGLLFTAALIASPRHGLLSKGIHRGRLALQIAREDVLGLLYRLEEAGLDDAEASARAAALIREMPGVGPVARRLAVIQLRRRDLIRPHGPGWRLTETGWQQASRLIRSHRLWETYLHRYMDVPADHVHSTAERLEHLTDAAVRRDLAAGTDTPTEDPHGRRIPGERDQRGDEPQP